MTVSPDPPGDLVRSDGVSLTSGSVNFFTTEFVSIATNVDQLKGC